ncbi:MAG: hypothetical protein RL748_1849 [Pseudomonadota bacterium]|jgi:hypothetical protein
MKPILISLALVLALCSCSSTRPGQKPQASTAAVTKPGGNGATATAGPAVVVSAVHAAPLVNNAANSASANTPSPATAQKSGMLTAAEVQQIPFQVAVSSVTVEKLAAQQGCTGGKGASLATEKGPVEVYKMQCDNGKVFLAKCELRQCKAFSWH